MRECESERVSEPASERDKKGRQDGQDGQMAATCACAACEADHVHLWVQACQQNVDSAVQNSQCVHWFHARKLSIGHLWRSTPNNRKQKHAGELSAAPLMMYILASEQTDARPSQR